jgi:hypothetical protein
MDVPHLPNKFSSNRTDWPAMEGTLSNKMNSIASTNPGYAEAVQRGSQILDPCNKLDISNEC